MIELEWEETLDRAAASVPTPELTSQPETAVSEVVDEMRIAAAQPTGAVVRAFAGVEVALYNALDTAGVPTKVGRYQPKEAVDQAVKAHLLTPAHAAVLADLRALRNQVAHSPEPSVTPAQATQYVMVADGLIAALKRAKDSRPSPERETE